MRFLKNIIGLWMIQETRRQYRREGEQYSYNDLEKHALASEPFRYFIDPDAPEFVAPGNIPRRIRAFCGRTGQGEPQTVGEIMRCIYESLALKYRCAFDQIRDCTGKDYHSIHMVGGGTKDNLLCRMAASSTGCRVVARADRGDRAGQHRGAADGAGGHRRRVGGAEDHLQLLRAGRIPAGGRSCVGGGLRAL